MKVFITKYALTQGILEKEGVTCNDISKDMIEVKGTSACGEYYHGKGREWHENRVMAEAKAYQLRDAKINALKKQIAKLEAMKF